jgi:hypothetical protein
MYGSGQGSDPSHAPGPEIDSIDRTCRGDGLCESTAQQDRRPNDQRNGATSSRWQADAGSCDLEPHRGRRRR